MEKASEAVGIWVCSIGITLLLFLLVWALKGKMDQVALWFKSLPARIIAYFIFQTMRRPLAEGWFEKAIYGIERWWPVPATAAAVALVIIEEPFLVNNLPFVFLVNIVVNMNLALFYYNGLLLQETNTALAEGEYPWFASLAMFLSLFLMINELLSALDSEWDRTWIFRRD